MIPQCYHGQASHSRSISQHIPITQSHVGASYDCRGVRTGRSHPLKEDLYTDSGDVSVVELGTRVQHSVLLDGTARPFGLRMSSRPS